MAPPEEIPPYPDLDLNDRHKRRLFIFFIFGTMIFVLIIALAAIKGYHFTESRRFLRQALPYGHDAGIYRLE